MLYLRASCPLLLPSYEKVKFIFVNVPVNPGPVVILINTYPPLEAVDLVPTVRPHEVPNVRPTPPEADLAPFPSAQLPVTKSFQASINPVCDGNFTST